VRGESGTLLHGVRKHDAKQTWSTLMRNLTLLCAAAIVASAASLSAAQAAGCMRFDPNCATYPMPKNDTSMDQSRHHYRSAYRGDGAADVAGAAVGTAAGIAAGAVDTAGAIATAPFRGADSYAYYNGGDGWNNGWNQNYAERNGFVCTPGTWFTGADGRRHPCQ
jgi:hypothetical protein